MGDASGSKSRPAGANDALGCVREPSGKVSFTRLSGLMGWVVLLAVFLSAAVQMQWETVRAMTGDIALLIAGLYGINKWFNKESS